MSRRTTLATVGLALALVAAAALAGCTSGDDDKPKDQPSASAVLEAAWQTSYKPSNEDASHWRLQWATDDVLVFADGDSQLVGIDVASGELRWQLRLPNRQTFCGYSADVSTDGAAGVLIEPLDLGRPLGCRVAAALEVGSGKLRWRKPIPGARYEAVMGVGVGEQTLTVAGRCGAFRYDLASGKARPAPAFAAFSCGRSTSGPLTQDVAVSGSRVVVLATNEWRCDDQAVLELYDADAGRREWRAPVSECADGTSESISLGHGYPNGIAHVDPLVLLVTARWKQAYRLVDSRGQLKPLSPGTLVGSTERALVVAGAGQVKSFDLQNGASKGRPLGSRRVDPTELLVGIHGDDVLGVQARESQASSEMWLTRSDPADGNEPTFVATLPAPTGAAGETPWPQNPREYDIAGDLLIEVTGDWIRGLRIPPGK